METLTDWILSGQILFCECLADNKLPASNQDGHAHRSRGRATRDAIARKYPGLINELAAQ